MTDEERVKNFEEKETERHKKQLEDIDSKLSDPNQKIIAINAFEEAKINIKQQAFIAKEWHKTINWTKFLVLSIVVIVVALGTIKRNMDWFDISVLLLAAWGAFAWGYLTSNTK
jgi:hypothetical protein